MDGHICDAIKQNEPELEKYEYSVSLSLYTSISELYHTENPIKNTKQMVPEIKPF